jgi:transposase
MKHTNLESIRQDHDKHEHITRKQEHTGRNTPGLRGIDVSKETLEFALNGIRATQTFGNDPKGIKALVRYLKGISRLGAIVMEATGRLGYEAALALCAAGWPVMVIDPRQTRRFGQAAGHLSRTNAIDAHCLAAQAHDLYPTDHRERLFMRLPTEAQETLLAWVTRRAQPIEIKVAEPHHRAGAPQSVQRSILSLIKTLNRQIGEIDDDIDRHMKEHFAERRKLLEGIEGVGVGTQALLLAALPEPGKPNRLEIAKRAGVAPLNHDSGGIRGRRSAWGGRATRAPDALQGEPVGRTSQQRPQNLLSAPARQRQTPKARPRSLHVQAPFHLERHLQARTTLAGKLRSLMTKNLAFEHGHCLLPPVL